MKEKEALVKNAADPDQVKRAENRIINGRDKELDDIRFILSTPQGRRVYWRLLSQFGIFKTSFTGNSTTFFNEGQRNAGLFLLSELNDADPEAYVLMMKESKLLS